MKQRVALMLLVTASLVLLTGCPRIFGIGGDSTDETGPRYWAVELNGRPLNGRNATAEVTLEAQDTQGTSQTMVFSQFGIELLRGGRFHVHSTYRREDGSGSGLAEFGHYSRSGEQITFTPERDYQGLEAAGTVRDPTMTLSGHWIELISETDRGELVFVRFPVELTLRRE
jgi:hypothetical protein